MKIFHHLSVIALYHVLPVYTKFRATHDFGRSDEERNLRDKTNEPNELNELNEFRDNKKRERVRGELRSPPYINFSMQTTEMVQKLQFTAEAEYIENVIIVPPFRA